MIEKKLYFNYLSSENDHLCNIETGLFFETLQNEERKGNLLVSYSFPLGEQSNHYPLTGKHLNPHSFVLWGDLRFPHGG